MKRGLLDFIIASTSLAILVLAFFYMKEAVWLMVSAGFLFALFVILGVKNRNQPLVYKETTENANSHSIPKELVLLSEEDTEMAGWDLFGRTSLIIGRDTGSENLVDVNLADVTYASFIEVEHAVMNYAGAEWYIEDLYSKNGVRVQKKGNGQQYKLAPEKPCKLEPGDIVYIAKTKMRIR